MSLIKKIRTFLKDNKIDYLLVNSTNEFLVEYPELQENARYILTDFSGSTGDALISQNDIFLFVDGRYHEQADQEVDTKLVKVVKMKPRDTFAGSIAKKVKTHKTFALVGCKNSQSRLEVFETNLGKKKVKIKVLDFDPVMGDKWQKSKEYKCEKIDTKITGMSADEKFQLVSKNLKKDEAIFITSLEEISYLCNLRDFSSNYSSQIKGCKCIIEQKAAILFADYPIPNVGKYFTIEKSFENYIKDSKMKTIFVDKTAINAYDYSLIETKVKPLKENWIKKMKAVKTKQEIEHYKTCFNRADKALMATREFINSNENISEYDITHNLEENFYKFGAKSLSFKSIVAKDQNSALAHYSKNSKTEVLEEGSLVLIDCGAYYEGGYATDCTRVFVKGVPGALQRKIYTMVLKGFLAAFNKKASSKTTGLALDKAARKILDKIAPAGFNFSHSLGHGIGINVHEAPPRLSYSPLAKTVIEPYMCFTIEPGLYKKSFGGVRLENSCYMDEEDGNLIIKSFSDMCFEQKLIDYNLLSKKEIKWLKNFKVQ